MLTGLYKSVDTLTLTWQRHRGRCRGRLGWPCCEYPRFHLIHQQSFAASWQALHQAHSHSPAQLWDRMTQRQRYNKRIKQKQPQRYFQLLFYNFANRFWVQVQLISKMCYIGVLCWFINWIFLFYLLNLLRFLGGDWAQWANILHSFSRNKSDQAWTMRCSREL